MGIKFTVNGVVYNSVEAMPPEARQIYEKALAEVPDLADRDGDGIPDAARSEGLSIKPRIVVRKKIIVNGVTYDNELAMPPEARRVFEQAMQAASSNDPTVRKREVKLSFHAGSGTPTAMGGTASSGPARLTLVRGAAPGATPQPIEPSGSGTVLRTGAILIALGLSAAVGLALYLWLRVG